MRRIVDSILYPVNVCIVSEWVSGRNYNVMECFMWHRFCAKWSVYVLWIVDGTNFGISSFVMDSHCHQQCVFFGEATRWKGAVVPLFKFKVKCIAPWREALIGIRNVNQKWTDRDVLRELNCIVKCLFLRRWCTCSDLCEKCINAATDRYSMRIFIFVVIGASEEERI